MISNCDENNTDWKPRLSAFEWIWNQRLRTSLAKVTIESSWRLESQNDQKYRCDRRNWYDQMWSCKGNPWTEVADWDKICPYNGGHPCTSVKKKQYVQNNFCVRPTDRHRCVTLDVTLSDTYFLLCIYIQSGESIVKIDAGAWAESIYNGPDSFIPFASDYLRR